ncbi:PorP/SprF family type IX secretion system membrane protein [Robertkochia aurantiaca]|uniref:PorP/SprF family type IX secretion system membrane protein n=1 Tax=Robertkochia aurantiaca TaxID=2873700 RepID=UPI001CC98E65|nr:type IX secretion system membrane protein PorP/SprF [Robertkochia sp. 3YJGBD-33]
MRLTMNDFNRCFFLICSLLSMIAASAQEGIPVYFDYLSDNYYLIHPSMAGAGQSGKARLTARKQWFDVERAPSLQTLNAHLRVGEKSGVGAILFNDRNGYHSQTGMKLTYAHHLMFSRNPVDLDQLSFGLSVGFIQSRLDESEFQSVIPDPVITGTATNVTYFNIDVGASYHLFEFYAHATIKNLLGSGRDLYSAQEFDNLRRYLFSVGYVFGKSLWQFEPSVMLQYAEFTQETAVDVNAKVYRNMDFGRIWGGLSFRQSFDGAQYILDGTTRDQRLQLLTPIVGVNVNNFMFSYNYSYQAGDVRFDNGGFHQITLGYDFLKGKEPYDCNCPAVNY